MQTRKAFIQLNTRITVTKPAILVLIIFMVLPNISSATSIGTTVKAGSYWIQDADGYQVTGTGSGNIGNSVYPGTGELVNDNATAGSSLQANWNGQYVNDQTGSSFSQSVFSKTQVGHLQVSSRVQSSSSITEPLIVHHSTSAEAWWRDTLVLTAAGSAAGYMSIDLDLLGNTFASGAGGIYFEEGDPPYETTWDAAAANWDLEIQLQGGANFSERYSGGTGSFTGDYDWGSSLPLSVYSNSIPITFGTPIEMYIALYVGTSANVYSPGDSSLAEGSFLNSLEWGGITRVVDADGNPIVFTLTSESGYDYRLAFSDSPQGNSVVPIPSSVILLGSGLIALVGLRRNRRKIF